MVILALFMLTLLCVYYFLHRTQKFSYDTALPDDQTGAEKSRATAASL
jgi:cbb3-type cytochrome oxidase subunit 3